MENEKPELTEATAKVNVKAVVRLPDWYIKPLNTNEQTLDLETRLYNGFGGWDVTKDGELYFMEAAHIEKGWKEWKQLKEIEEEAKKDPNHDWRCNYNLPLRGGSYQRHDNDKWVLIESNRGFA